MEARLRDLGLCPQGGDWPHLNCVLKRWLCCPGLRQDVGDEALQGMGRKLDRGPREVGAQGSGGPWKLQVQKVFAKDRTRFGACWRWEGGQGS